MVNDLLSQVKSMDLFGKGTRPCKDPRNPRNDGSYYTIPVKLSFSNKQVSKHVNEILRQKYKVSTSIPYHRTLKQAITMAHEKISKQNPGKQVLISLDAPKKCLKPFIRDPPRAGAKKGENGWLSAGNPIPLPAEALNSKLKEVSEEFSLPTSPTMVNSNSAGSISHDPHPPPPSSGTGITHQRLKMTPEVAQQVAEKAKSQENSNNEDDSVFNPPKEGETMEVENTSEINGSLASGLGPEY
jgi:hypothetical protein